MLIDQGLGGDIVYISSKNSVFAGPNNIAYSATKADQAHQVRLLAAELGEHGIKVNGVNPDGVVRGSGIFAGGWGAKRAAVYGVDEEDLGEFYAQRTLLKREVLPEHVANAVFALVGPRPDPHDRPAHPGRRGRRRRVPPLTVSATVEVAAVDLGASSGRVMLGEVGPDHAAADGRGALRQRPGRGGDGLHWDVPGLHRHALDGLRARRRDRVRPARQRRHRLVGGRLRTARAAAGCLAEPFHYRDERRGEEGPRRVHDLVPAADLYARNGLQFLPFNTVYQLAADERIVSRRPAAPGARPAGLLADRRGGRRAHQRLHDRAACPSPPAAGTTS